MEQSLSFVVFIVKPTTGSPALIMVRGCRESLWEQRRAAERRSHAVLLSCLSLNAGDACLLSSETRPRRFEVSSREFGKNKNKTRLAAHKHFCLSTRAHLGLKMVIKVYIASSSGSVAVSVLKTCLYRVDSCVFKKQTYCKMRTCSSNPIIVL